MQPLILIGMLLLSLLGGSCAPGPGFDARLNSIVKPHLFSIARWESQAIPSELGHWLFGRRQTTDNEITLVAEYFAASERIKTLESEIEAVSTDADPALPKAEVDRLQARRMALESTVERIIERQIRDALTQQGIFNPLTELRVSFPPVNFKLGKPPYLLVISPRDRIESIREITLTPTLTLEEIEDIEARVDELGVSSLVVALGGLGATYPTFVTNEGNLRSTIETTAEEWLHQYLAFKPLGFLYLLDLIGISRDYEIATMNETLASMVSKELAAMVYEEHYSEYENGARQPQPAGPEFDFNREMRDIRKTVDRYLTQGEIELAEEFMEEKRRYLASMGYYIRKLNQAYFAFHGTYADSPTSISPIGLELKEIRAQSTSVKHFLDTVAAMTSRQSLIDSLE